MSELMISQSILDLDGRFENVESMNSFTERCNFIGTCYRKRSKQQIDNKTPVR